MEDKEKRGKRKYYSVLYPWQKKPLTEVKDMEKRAKQLKGVYSFLIVMVIFFLAITILTAQWAGLILAAVSMFFLFNVREENKRIRSMLGQIEKK